MRYSGFVRSPGYPDSPVVYRSKRETEQELARIAHERGHMVEFHQRTKDSVRMWEAYPHEYRGQSNPVTLEPGEAVAEYFVVPGVKAPDSRGYYQKFQEEAEAFRTAQEAASTMRKTYSVWAKVYPVDDEGIMRGHGRWVKARQFRPNPTGEPGMDSVERFEQAVEREKEARRKKGLSDELGPDVIHLLARIYMRGNENPAGEPEMGPRRRSAWQILEYELGREQGVTRRHYAYTLAEAQALAAGLPGEHPMEIFQPDTRRVIRVRNLGMGEAVALGAAAGVAQGLTEKVMRNPFSGVRYFLGLAEIDPARFEREAAVEGVLIEKRRLVEFIAGAGSPLTQYTVTLPDGARGFMVPRRGFPGGKQHGKVWYEWVGLPRAKGNPLPPRDPSTMIDAIALSSPSGRMSKRARRAAEKRLHLALFGPGGIPGPQLPPPEPESVRLRRHAGRLRELAARGMSVRKYTREADKAERRAEELERQGNPASLDESTVSLLRSTHNLGEYDGLLRLLQNFRRVEPALDLEPALRLSIRIAAADIHKPGIRSLAEALQYTQQASFDNLPSGEYLLEQLASGVDPTSDHRFTEKSYRGGGVLYVARAKQILGRQGNPVGEFALVEGAQPPRRTLGITWFQSLPEAWERSQSLSRMTGRVYTVWERTPTGWSRVTSERAEGRGGRRNPQQRLSKVNRQSHGNPSLTLTRREVYQVA